MRLWLGIWLVLTSIPLLAWQPVTDQRLQQAYDDADNWLSHGRSYREQRFSPLRDINDSNIADLGLAWAFEIDSEAGMEATPLVVDGRMYVTAPWSVVYALDAASGAVLWKYDPRVRRDTSIKFCCGSINRGAAVWGGNVYAGTLDGRLLAIDARSGELVWETQTTDPDKSYSITGAPRVVNGKVIIGNGGSEFGVRGYVTAYDAASGEQVWRFHTVPGNPADGFETPAMARAAETWTGEWWRMGGGGTVWDAIAFDPELNLLYIGVGNGAPHNRNLRSPDGGDNLYLSSIVALDPDTGDYVWHYQEVPGETWDYTATQQMTLVDIEWRGEPRKVIMHAPKAGFFFLIDRQTGELLSAEPYVKVTWASHYDLQTGRPVENPGQRYSGEKALVYPTALGGHNWHPMSYSPLTGLMYIPALDFGSEFKEITAEDFEYLERHWNVGYDIGGPRGPDLFVQSLMANLPRAYLLAWDPIAQREAWRVEHPRAHNGGTLATAGNLVFQGTSDNFFHAYRADTGERLWTAPVQSGVMAGAISYRVNGEQYIATTVGRGGAASVSTGVEPPGSTTKGRVLAFKLGGEASLPPVPEVEFPAPPSRLEVSDEDLERGHTLYHRFCARCHGINAVGDGSVPDLRRLPAVWHEHFDKVVLDGMMEGAGMPRFDDVLDPEAVRQVHAYIIDRANEDAELRATSGWWISTQRWFYDRVVAVMGWLMESSVDSTATMPAPAPAG